MRRSPSILAAVAVAALAFAPSFADARAGGGTSSGSRGSRTYSAPSSTNTAPSAAPMERTTTPRANPSAPMGQPMQQPARSGFGSGLMGGIAGGLLGVGLGSLLFGGGLFGNGSMLGFLSLLIQAALLFFLVRWAVRAFMRRQQQPAMAGGPNPMNRMAQPAPQQAPVAMQGAMVGGAAVTIQQADYQAFERLLQSVQGAWSAGDANALRQLATPEMAGYFQEQLQEQASRGVRNTVTHVKLEQGDLSEAWADGEREYATVAMRFSSLDVTRDSAGRVVEGDIALRSMATEFWTFVRVRGGRWILSAIQQTR